MNAQDEIFAEFEKIFSSSPQPGQLEFPPNITVELGTELIDYKKGKYLKGKFVVQKKHTNPMGFLQGGILTAMFDNIIGPLSYLAARNPATTLDLTTNYLRSAKPGEEIIIEASVTAKGVRTLFIEAKAYNQKNKLIATASSNNMILKK